MHAREVEYIAGLKQELTDTQDKIRLLSAANETLREQIKILRSMLLQEREKKCRHRR